MDICETYSDRKLFCNDWEFYKAAFGSDYSEDFAFKPEIGRASCRERV